MNCIIPGGNIKVISKSIQSLAKIGDELYLEAKNDNLSFTSINMMKTAFATYKYFDSFFSSYEIQDCENNVSCKLHMKSALSIFKFKPHKEKTIELCKIEMETDSSKIIFKFRYKHDLTVVHVLNLIDYESLSVSYDINDRVNSISASGQLFTHVLHNFQLTDTDMSFEIMKNKMVVRNYDTSISKFQKGIRSQITLTENEFNCYNITQEGNVTLSLKPFRSAIHFAEIFNLPVLLNFETGGRPTILILKSPTFEAHYVMSTVNPDGETQTTMSTPSLPKPRTKTKTNDTNITIQDKDAMESINWDNEFCFDKEPTKKTPSFNDVLKKLKNKKSTNGNSIGFSSPEFSSNLNDNPDLDIVPTSPESPKSKKAKIVFSRCNEATFHTSMLHLGTQLAANSDSDSDETQM